MELVSRIGGMLGFGFWEDCLVGERLSGVAVSCKGEVGAVVVIGIEKWLIVEVGNAHRYDYSSMSSSNI